MTQPRQIVEGSHIDFLEEVIEDLSVWANNYIDTVVSSLAPDGRVFGMKKLSEKEEIQLYRSQLRGNPQAWTDWIEERVNNIKELMANSGMGEDMIRAVHPYDIVERFALKFSYRMERLMKEYEDNALQSLRPADASEEVSLNATADSGHSADNPSIA